MPAQLQHQDHTPASPKLSIYLICDRISSPANLGSLFRSADAFGVDRIFLYQMQDLLHSKRLRRTSRSTEDRIPSIHLSSLPELHSLFDKEKFILVAIELTSGSKSLATFEPIPNKTVVLIVGNENFGISEELLALADLHLHIDMYGHNSSMNVAVATGIALYEIRKQQLTHTNNEY